MFDFILSQLFFIDILYHKKITTYKNDIENRIPNREFAYGFRKNAKFLARYNNEFKVIDYLIHTNDLGFRDSSVRELNREKKYSIVIGDSFLKYFSSSPTSDLSYKTITEFTFSHLLLFIID